MNARKLKPYDYRISVCIIRRIESMYNTKTCQNLNSKVGTKMLKATFKINSLIKMLAMT